MRKIYIVATVVVVFAWIVVGIIVASGPQPEIIVPAEVITKLGPLNITNTLISAWMAMAVLILGTFLATRSMKLLPSGAQNFVEAGVEFLVGQLEDIAGQKNGRRFFTVIATFFLFILMSNWMGLLPFFNAIGKTEDVGHEIFHEIEEHYEDGHDFVEEVKHGAWLVDDTGIGLVRPNAEDAEFEIKASLESPMTPSAALDRYVVFLAETFTEFDAEAFVEAANEGVELSATELKELAEVVTPGMLRAAVAALAADRDAPILLSADDRALAAEGEEEGAESHESGVPSALLGDELVVAGVEFPGQKLALIIPYFRSAYSDVNNTLALALISFVMVEFWGLQTLGLGYLKKFFNFSGVIPAFVGLLELLSEFIRIISFSFRLFGNIFAGEVLVLMLTFLVPFLIVDIIYGLELFVGFIQATVFALLTLVFAVMAVEHHDADGEHQEDEAGLDMESQGSPGQ